MVTIPVKRDFFVPFYLGFCLFIKEGFCQLVAKHLVNQCQGIMMAVAVMASIPMIILFLTLSKYFVSKEGVTSATKG